MKKRKNARTESEISQADFLLSGVGVFLDHAELSSMTIQNDYGAIVVNRCKPLKGSAFAVGFSAELNEEEHDEDGEAENNGVHGLKNEVQKKWISR